MNNNKNNSSTYIFSNFHQSSPNTLHDSLNACLCKAEALAAVAVSVDFEMFDSEVASNYLWTLTDLVREARCLAGKFVSE